MGEGAQRLPGPRPTFAKEGREDTLPTQKLAAASGWIGTVGTGFVIRCSSPAALARADVVEELPVIDHEDVDPPHIEPSDGSGTPN
jgi:hypothetical protein